jgi:chromate reductase
MTRILLITGSTRDDSLHTAALRTAARVAPGGITATVFDGLATVPPFVPGELAVRGAMPLIRHIVGEAEALLFCTPEYAGSLPGTLKNLLDHLVAGGDLHGKPAAWLSVAAAGQDDGARAELEKVLRHGGARVLANACVRIPLRVDAVDASGLVNDAQLHVALRDMLSSLAGALSAPPQRDQPSWQAYSSVYPIVQQRADPRAPTGPRAELWRAPTPPPPVPDPYRPKPHPQRPPADPHQGGS